ncbi:hypothetical protein ABVK25_002031 [Lepraria finkii]|uniref:DUF6594 domain-containing protein n=1 Tax=Lepraria finkii TaxID=1340010 RepID=A0ABR4BJQ5_9LECA
MEGYAKLSSLISTDSEFAMYRKFGAQNTQSLLCYQAELISFGDDLQQLAASDRRSQDTDKRLHAENWYELSRVENGKDQQIKKFDKIRKDNCLIQQTAIAKLDRLAPYNLRNLRRWLTRSAFGSSFLYGLEARAWDEVYDHDLLAFPRSYAENDKDALPQLFLGPLLELFHNLIGRLYKKGTTKDTLSPEPLIRYYDSNILRVADILITIISSGLPIASITALNYINRTITRLVVVAVFTVTSSLFLTFLTSLRRTENFAVTAGFAAVQVVFVGTATGAGNGGLLRSDV